MTKRTLFQTLLAGIVGVKVAPTVVQAAPVLDPAFKVGGDVAVGMICSVSNDAANKLFIDEAPRFIRNLEERQKFSSWWTGYNPTQSTDVYFPKKL